MYADPSDQNQIGGVTLQISKSIHQQGYSDMVEFGLIIGISNRYWKDDDGVNNCKKNAAIEKISKVFVVAPNQQILDKWKDVLN